MKKAKKKKLEFTQKWLIGCGIVTVVFLAMSFIWSMLGFDPLQDLSAAIVQTTLSLDGVSVGAYALQNSVRAYSADRWGYNPPDDDGEEGAVE